LVQRILVVDDDKQIVRLLRTYLEQSGYQIFVAYDGESALHIIRREQPDLVLLDLMLPDRDGWELTRVVRSDPGLQGLPVIMLTARADDQDKIVGLELGADDYVTKPFNPREVVARVRAVLRRAHGEAPPQKMLRVGPLTMDVDGHQALVQGRPVHLTRTEFKLLRVLVENPGRTFTRLELIEKALGYGYEGLERSVDSHVKNLRRKLDEANAGNGLIETVFGVGYRLPTEEEA
jgi:two-component system, OmpR family, alkaline phosphatase synthesis response regulator PhoP